MCTAYTASTYVKLVKFNIEEKSLPHSKNHGWKPFFYRFLFTLFQQTGRPLTILINQRDFWFDVITKIFRHFVGGKNKISMALYVLTSESF